MKRIVNFKKTFTLLVAAVMLISAFAGCSDVKRDSSGKLKIVTTIFPEYDWMKNLTKDVETVELTMLLDKGVDLHSYQPTADDIISISDCDMFVYVGGESDEWVDDALKESTNKDMTVINLLEILGDAAKEEETVEGMQEDADENDGDEVEYDEHVWLSLKNAKTLCSKICEKLIEKDAAHKTTYTDNLKTYIAELDKLDAQYKAVCGSAKNKTLVFGDRFPFRYMTDDYGLTYYAAFSGCSAESEASFKTVVFLAEKLNRLKLGSILTIDGSDQKLAQSIVDTAKAKNVDILTLHSMQSATADGETYLNIMHDNLEVLKKALN